jgi:acetolactate synthase-1/2/3 large subunit
VTEITGSKYLADTIKGYGLSHVFMVPTIAVTALAEMDRIDVVGISAHGEKAAAYMADGYARASRGPAVCLAQTIGATNLAAGLRDAYIGHSPVIAFTGGTEPMTRQKGVYQEIEDFPIFEKLTKYNMQIDDTRRLPDLLRQGFRIATSGAPQPVHLELQGIVGTVLDGWFTPTETDLQYQSEARYAQLPPHRPAPEEADVAAAVELIARAERPLIVAGQGVRISGAMDELKAFAEKAQIPVATTLTAKGALDENGPLAVGVIGGAARPSANTAGKRADLVIFVGTSTGSQATSGWTLPAYGTETIQIDIEPSQLGRNYPPAVGMLADAKAALAALTAAYEAPVSDERRSWVDEVAGYVSEFREEFRGVMESTDAPTRPERLCKEISDFLPDDGVLVVDTGHAGIWAGGYIDMKPTQEILRAMGSLGWAVPASIGAKAAVGDRTVVCLTGDGGFYYHLQEIETAARHGLAPIIVVNNNVALSQDMKIFQYSWGGPEQISERGDNMWIYTDVELAQVAERLGAFSIRVDDPADIRGALEAAKASGRVAIVEVRTPAEALPPTPDFYTSLVKNLTPNNK